MPEDDRPRDDNEPHRPHPSQPTTDTDSELPAEISGGAPSEMMQDSGRLFLQLANTVPAYLWIGDAQGYITFLNDVWYKNTGRTPEQSLGTAWAEVLHPDDVDRCLAIWQESLSEGRVYEIEVRYRMADGTYRWVLARAEPLRDASGKITNWFGTSIDIEDRRRAEMSLLEARDELEHRVEQRTAELAEAMDDLKESQRRFRLAVEHYPSTFVIYDADRRIQYINSNGAEVIGRPEAEIIGKRDEDVRPPDGVEAFQPLLVQAISTRQRQTAELTVDRGDRHVTLIVTYVPILDDDGEISQVLGITHDITARKQAEEQREILHTATETAGEGILLVDPDGHIVYTNPALEEIFGYGAGELDV